MAKDEKINYTTRPVPSGPGKLHITVEGQKSQKGGSDFVSKAPTQYTIPGDTSSKGKMGIK